MTKLDRLHISINSVIGFAGIVIGLIGLGIAPSLIVKSLFGILFVVGVWRLVKVILRFLRTPSPYHPFVPVIPPDFVGRDTLLRQFNEALKNAESLSLVGDSRMGKTSLLKTWQQQLKTTGRTVIFVDGSQTTTSLLPALIHAITQQDAPDSPDQAANVLQQWAIEMTTSTKLPPY
jgi:hypothetical protein